VSMGDDDSTARTQIIDDDSKVPRPSPPSPLSFWCQRDSNRPDRQTTLLRYVGVSYNRLGSFIARQYVVESLYYNVLDCVITTSQVKVGLQLGF
jgi:hypothetical protein